MAPTKQNELSKEEANLIADVMFHLSGASSVHSSIERSNFKEPPSSQAGDMQTSPYPSAASKRTPLIQSEYACSTGGTGADKRSQPVPVHADGSDHSTTASPFPAHTQNSKMGGSDIYIAGMEELLAAEKALELELRGLESSLGGVSLTRGPPSISCRRLQEPDAEAVFPGVYSPVFLSPRKAGRPDSYLTDVLSTATALQGFASTRPSPPVHAVALPTYNATHKNAHLTFATGKTDASSAQQDHVSSGAAAGAAQTSNASTAASPMQDDMPMPQRTLSLLQEMREQLRLNQAASQLNSPQAPQPDSSKGADGSGPSAGTTPPEVPSGRWTAQTMERLMLELSETSRPVSPASTPFTPAAAVADTPAGHTPATTPHKPTSSSIKGKLPSQPLTPRSKSQHSSSSAANGAEQPSPPLKSPIVVSKDEQYRRLSDLYSRTVEWRKRCESRYDQERRILEQETLAGCTFSPQLNRASLMMVQGSPTSVVYSELARERQSHSAHSPAAPGAGAGLAATNIAADSARTPPKVDSAAVGARLYSHANDLRSKAEERVRQTLQAEEAKRKFIAQGPAAKVQPRVYQPQDAAKTPRHLPSGMEDCTFHPRTRYHTHSSNIAEDTELQRFDNDLAEGLASLAGLPNGRPKSTPHTRPDGQASSLVYENIMAAGLGSQHELANSHALSITSRNHSQAPTTAAISKYHMSDQLDWDEFITRQEQFLAERNQRVEGLKQTSPAAPTMSPGSKKIMRERVQQQQMYNERPEAAASRSAWSSPGSDVRPVAIQRSELARQEMMKECTFHPEITRKAAQRPATSIDDMVDGGRQRRDEWLEQQRALQQVKEVEDATFQPTIYTRNAYSEVKSRINLRQPDVYQAHVAVKRRQAEYKRQELLREREQLEMQHCTFKPQTTPLPGYLVRMAAQYRQAYLDGLYDEQDDGLEEPGLEMYVPEGRY